MPSSPFFAKLTALAAASFALAAPLAAVSTDTAVQVTYDHFEDGKMENISIPGDGGLRLSPALEHIAKLDAAVIWKAVADKNGNATAITVIKNVERIPEHGWYVNIHRTTMLMNQTGFDPIDCGNVQGR